MLMNPSKFRAVNGDESKMSCVRVTMTEGILFSRLVKLNLSSTEA